METDRSNHNPPPSPMLARKLQRAARLLEEGNLQTAGDLCSHLLAQSPREFSLLMLASRVAQRQGNLTESREFARRATAQRPRNVDATLRLALCCFYDSDTLEAMKLALSVESSPECGVGALRRLAEVYRHMGHTQRAYRCLARALDKDPQNADLTFEAAMAAADFQDLKASRSLLERAIFLNPEDYDAWYWRAAFKEDDGEEDHHVQELGFVLDHLEPDDPGRAHVCYALARELERLGEHDFSFRCLREGARIRKVHGAYDVSGEETALKQIAEAFDATLLERSLSDSPGPRPTFLVGLPESGHSWLSSWLAAHERFSALGDTETFNYAVLGAVGPNRGGQDLLDKAAGACGRDIAQRYARAVVGRELEIEETVDSGNRNFLYIGLIKRAFPNARIVHVRREPLDHCFGLFRRLFEYGVPYGGQMSSITRYYTAYHRLMGHWRRHLAGAFIDVDYEKLRMGNEATVRALSDHLGTSLDMARQPNWPLDPQPGLAAHHPEALAAAAQRLKSNGIPLG